jgi:hypothetical protein
MNFKIFRQMKTDKIRGICIKHELYTSGNNDAYFAMFDKATQKKDSADEFNQHVTIAFSAFQSRRRIVDVLQANVRGITASLDLEFHACR